jgi:hypothetical protein
MEQSNEALIIGGLLALTCIPVAWIVLIGAGSGLYHLMQQGYRWTWRHIRQV